MTGARINATIAAGHSATHIRNSVGMALGLCRVEPTSVAVTFRSAYDATLTLRLAHHRNDTSY